MRITLYVYLILPLFRTPPMAAAHPGDIDAPTRQCVSPQKLFRSSQRDMKKSYKSQPSLKIPEILIRLSILPHA